MSFERDTYIYHVGDVAEDIFCMLRGTTIISAVHPVIGLLNGALMQPGFWFGEPAALGHRPRLTSVLTRKSCNLLAVPVETVHEMIRERPDCAWAFFDLMANNAEDYVTHAIDLMIQNPRRRFCSRLMTLAGRRGKLLPDQPVSIPLSQDELALTSAMSRQTVSQLLGELVALGICRLAYREVVVLDAAALAVLVTADRPDHN